MANTLTLPLLSLRYVVAFPYLLFNLDVSEQRSISAVEYAQKNHGRILLLTQKQEEEAKTSEDFYKTGVIADIRQVIKLPNGSVRVFFSSEYRAVLKKITFEEEYISYPPIGSCSL